MAIRLFVEPTLAIRAVATTNSLRIVAPQFRAAAALVSRPTYAAVVSYPLYQADLSYQQLISLAAYLKLEASDVILDPDTKNRYFRDLDSLTPIEAHALALNKPLSPEAVGLSDLTSLRARLNKQESFGMTDELSILLTYLRDFFDGAALADATAIGLSKIELDSIGALDEISDKDFAKGLAENSSLLDAPAILFGQALSDSVSVADSYAAVISYIRAFTENITAVSDSRPVLDVGLGVSDELLAIEAISFALESLISEQLEATDSSSIDYSHPEADGISTSDTFNRVVVFSRAFSDAFALDDNATVGGVIKDTQTVKNNVLGFSETQEFDFSKGLTDSFTMSEVASRINQKTLDDDVNIVESLTISKSSAASSVFNAAAFNIAPLNN